MCTFMSIKTEKRISRNFKLNIFKVTIGRGFEGHFLARKFYIVQFVWQNLKTTFKCLTYHQLYTKIKLLMGHNALYSQLYPKKYSEKVFVYEKSWWDCLHVLIKNLYTNKQSTTRTYIYTKINHIVCTCT